MTDVGLPIASPSVRASHYTLATWRTSTGEDPKLWRAGLIRPDMISALLYARGHFVTYQGEPQPPDVALGIVRSTTAKRDTDRVLDIGCGRGEMEAMMASLGMSFTAVDFSEDAIEITRETIAARATDDQDLLADWVVDWDIVKHAAADIGKLHPAVRFNTVLMSEVLEHIPADEFELAFAAIRKWEPLLIITNWLEYHPIERDKTDWNHVRRVDDEVFDMIASCGQTRLRHGSHLVVQL